ncbi:MAG: alpha/beta hydrolase family protein [Phycisphaerales bacterium]
MIEMLWRVGGIGFLGLAMMGGGCRSVSLASIGLVEVPNADSGHSVSTVEVAQKPDDEDSTPSRWPTRWGDDPDRPGIIIEEDPAVSMVPIHLSRDHQFRSTQIEYDDANTLAGELGIEHGFRFRAEGPGCFLFIPDPLKTSPQDPGKQERATLDLTHDSGKVQKDNLPDLAFKFVSASELSIPETRTMNITNSDGKEYAIELTPAGWVMDAQGERTVDTTEDHVLLQRTWFTYRDAKGKRGGDEQNPGDPIGTIVLLPGIFGTPDPVVDALEKYWNKKGYAIVRMRSQPSRFTEHFGFETTPDQVLALSQQVAQMNDDRVAEGAFATKAAIEHVFEQRPVLVDRPVILIGMSGGAMMLPTVYAYAPELYQGAVLIAGGADFARIAIRSNYRSWIDAITFDFDPDSPGEGRIDKEHLDAFCKVYLADSKLDAYHTATEMRSIPVLMLHGTADQAVPSATGDLLYEQLGEPERWSYPVGHELIFAGLATQVVRIDRWIHAHVIE